MCTLCLRSSCKKLQMDAQSARLLDNSNPFSRNDSTIHSRSALTDTFWPHKAYYLNLSLYTYFMFTDHVKCPRGLIYSIHWSRWLEWLRTSWIPFHGRCPSLGRNHPAWPQVAGPGLAFFYLYTKPRDKGHWMHWNSCVQIACKMLLSLKWPTFADH